MFDSKKASLPGVWANCRRDGDGVWFCCDCQREHTLRHQSGQHPFGNLRCLDCRHIICDECTTSGIFKLYPDILQDPVPVPAFDINNREIPYGCVCKDCGETFRAVRCKRRDRGLLSFVKDIRKGVTYIRFTTGQLCCGEPISTICLRFSIGTSSDYKHGDPNAAWALSQWRHFDQHLYPGVVTPSTEVETGRTISILSIIAEGSEKDEAALIRSAVPKFNMLVIPPSDEDLRNKSVQVPHPRLPLESRGGKGSLKKKNSTGAMLSEQERDMLKPPTLRRKRKSAKNSRVGTALSRAASI